MYRFKTLSVLAFGLVLSSAIAEQPSQKVDPNLGDMMDNYLTSLQQKDFAERQKEIAALTTPAAIHQRQEYIHKTLLHELGGFPATKTPLHAQVTGTIEHEDYKVEKLVYQSLPHFYVTANLYIPKHGKKPYPAVLGLTGHTQAGKAPMKGTIAWVSMARRGIMVLAIDPVGQGERVQHLDPVTHKPTLRPNGTMEHMTDGLPALLTGSNIARYEIWDGIRGIDYLISRGDVDPKRIATAGNSGGGTQSAYISTMDSRVAVAVISCYMTSWQALWLDPGPQDSEQIFNRFIADHLNYGDFMIRIAPRPGLMEFATQDFFPIKGAHDTFAEAKGIYKTLGVPDHVASFEYDDKHGWSQPRREAAYKWLSRWLLNKEDDGKEEPAELNTTQELQVTPTGYVLSSYTDAESLQQINAKLAEKLRAKPLAVSSTQLASIVRKRLDLPMETKAPSVEQVGSASRDGMRIEKIKIQSEQGIIVPGMVFIPSSGAARKPAILYVNSAGMDGDAVAGGPIDHLVQQGNIVLAIDPRGWGESLPPTKWTSGYPSNYQMPMRAILVGKPMPATQTYDVLRAFQYLAKRPDVNPREISLYTQGKASNIGLMATAVEPRIHKIVMDKEPMSYVAMTEQKTNRLDPDMFLPGVLLDFDLPDLIRIMKSRVQIGK